MTEQRFYFLQCPRCKGEEFKLNQIIEKYNDDLTWEAMLTAKLYAHPGVGWDVDDFDFVCAKCLFPKPEVNSKCLNNQPLPPRG